MSNAAFAATYSDLKLVKSRKCAQIVLEIPIEQAQAFVAAYGMPNPEAEQWVGIAPLDLAPKEREKSEGERAVQRAALLCQDREFRKWAARDHPDVSVFDNDMAADWLREQCGITSRSELKDNTEARKRFEGIEADFQYRNMRR